MENVRGAPSRPGLWIALAVGVAGVSWFLLGLAGVMAQFIAHRGLGLPSTLAIATGAPLGGAFAFGFARLRALRTLAALLSLLYDISTRPEMTCRVRWQTGSVCIWDNRWLQHYAIDDYADFERLMYRVTITGERPV